jgi:hypothetical protein
MARDDYMRKLIKHIDDKHIETRDGLREIDKRFDSVDAKLDAIKDKLNGKVDKVDLDEYANTLGLNTRRYGKA